jgi:NO-binding membrane sensor protein with MHYT domain
MLPGLAWLTAAAVVAGCGVWATHFVAMPAFRPGIPIGYDVRQTAVSVAFAVSLMWLGFAVSFSLPAERLVKERQAA